MFRLLSLASARICSSMSKSYGGLSLDFLWSLVALVHLMRLSLLKAAHANLFSAACRKSGSPSFSTHVRWGERGAPVQFLWGSAGQRLRRDATLNRRFLITHRTSLTDIPY